MIIGAGFSGLITAYLLRREQIFEAAKEPAQNHKALLRFRSDIVSRLTGIEFQKVRVRKGIFYRGAFVEPNIYYANAYSKKCLGVTLGDRSIWNLDPVDRFIAPENFYDQLLEGVGDRINWGSEVNLEPHNTQGEPIISTAPLHVTAKALGINIEGVDFKHAAITVVRYRLPNFNVHQTVYFPSPEHNLYRASITGSLLMLEFAGDAQDRFAPLWMNDMFTAFNIYGVGEIEQIDQSRQVYGKIAAIDERVRKAIISELTAKHDVFSIGRFATWRNILLDDIVNDAEVVKKLISATGYERRIAGV